MEQNHKGTRGNEDREEKEGQKTKRMRKKNGLMEYQPLKSNGFSVKRTFYDVLKSPLKIHLLEQCYSASPPLKIHLEERVVQLHHC